MKKIHIISILCLLVLFSCRKDGVITTVDVEEDAPLILVRNTLRGKVVAENGDPVENALVSIRGYSTRTDKAGVFKFIKIDVPGEGGLVTVKIENHFQATKFVNFSADGSSYSQITVLEKGTLQIFDNRISSNIAVGGGAEINFPPNSMVTSSGVAFNGNVGIQTRYLDPLAENLGEIMPGQLTGIDEDGNEFALATYGMVVFELESEDGQMLDLAEGATAEIKMPIPPELDGTAPDEIPLWQFDLDEEQWLLKGKCVKQGAYYVGQVSGSGYWNCDVALPAICLSGTILNADSTFASYVKVVVEDLTDNFIYWGYTDSLGFFCGSVPQAAPLRITIYDHCDNELYNEEIGPYGDDFELSTIYLDAIVNEYFLTITGMVSHCLTNDIPAGHVAIRYPGSLRVFPFDGGGFAIPLGLKCTDFPEMEITTYSSSQFLSTETVIHNTFEDLDITPQFICDTIVDTIHLKVDNIDYFISPTQWSFRPNMTTDWLIMEGVTPYGDIKIELRDYLGEGQYDVNVFFEVTNKPLSPLYPALSASSPDITVNVTDDDGNFIKGNVTGNAKNVSGQDLPIEINFVVRKAP